MTGTAMLGRATPAAPTRRSAGRKVLLPAGMDASGRQFLADHGYRVVLLAQTSRAALMAELADAEAVIARTERYPQQVLAAAPRLRVIARHGVGIDGIDLAEAERRGIWVTVTRNCTEVSVAEHAVALLLACSRRIVALDRAVRSGRWSDRDQLVAGQLHGRTLGLLGVGRTGQQVARIAHHGLGMRVVGCRQSGDAASTPEFVTLCGSPEEVYAQADAISVHLPLTPRTTGMLDATAFDQMRPGVILVNTARGGVVHERDLVTALRTGRIGFAALDVFFDEPLGRRSRLLELPNVIATPHVAGMSAESRAAMALSAARSVHDVLSGRTPQHPVNRPCARRHD